MDERNLEIEGNTVATESLTTSEEDQEMTNITNQMHKLDTIQTYLDADEYAVFKDTLKNLNLNEKYLRYVLDPVEQPWVFRSLNAREYRIFIDLFTKLTKPDATDSAELTDKLDELVYKCIIWPKNVAEAMCGGMIDVIIVQLLSLSGNPLFAAQRTPRKPVKI